MLARRQGKKEKGHALVCYLVDSQQGFGSPQDIMTLVA